MQTAKNSHACVSAALNGLMAEAFARTQKEWLKKHPDADMDSAIAEFTEALSAYGRGEKFVQKALEDAGFISPTPGSNEMALLSFAGQQAAMMEERGTKYSIQTLPDGTQYVMVDTDQHIFDGVDESEYKKIARDYIKQRFSGKYLGPNADVYVTKRSAEEYAFPVNRRMDREIKKDKYKASTELDNLLFVSQYERSETDDGHHPDATGGWEIYKTLYKVADRFYTGETKVKITENGKLFHDVTKIKDVTRQLGSTAQNEQRPGPDNISVDSVAEKEEKVNQKFSLKETVDQTETEEFKRWFGESEVVDENEKPLVVYHTTKSEYALNEEKSAKLRSSDTTAHRSKTEVYSDKAIAAAVGELGFSGPSEVKNTSVNYNIAQNSETVKSQEEEFSDKNTK